MGGLLSSRKRGMRIVIADACSERLRCGAHAPPPSCGIYFILLDGNVFSYSYIVLGWVYYAGRWPSCDSDGASLQRRWVCHIGPI